MSIYMLIFAGVTPLGALYSGTIIEHFAIPPYLHVSGIIGGIASIFALYTSDVVLQFIRKRNRNLE